jgi:hypothetical protein
MTLVEYPFWRTWGMEGVAEWQVNWVMVSKIKKKKSSKPDMPWTIASHLSHGVIVGVAFRLLLYFLYPAVPLLRVSIILDGAVLGITLWVLFLVLPRKLYETSGKIEISNRGLLAALLSDFLYGLFLGLFIAAV